MDGLFFELPTGLRINGEVHKEVELLKTNGVAEKIFLKRIPDKPFTWQGNIAAAAIRRIGNIEVGAEVRRKYLQDNAVTIPSAILNLPLAEINTILVEVHRRVWVSFFPKQEIICKYCGKKLLADIDLDKIDYTPEAKELMETLVDYEHIIVDLKDGFTPMPIPKITDKPENAGITDTCFNRFVFRVPLLKDAIRFERNFSDSIGFWRRIALECLESIQLIENDEVIGVLPSEFHTYYGIKIFDNILSGKDLRTIRNSLMEYLPTLPYAYYEPCGCDRQEEIPMVMEASNFFSE